jgi:hypothetical protein
MFTMNKTDQKLMYRISNPNNCSIMSAQPAGMLTNTSPDNGQKPKTFGSVRTLSGSVWSASLDGLPDRENQDYSFLNNTKADIQSYYPQSDRANDPCSQAAVKSYPQLASHNMELTK